RHRFSSTIRASAPRVWLFATADPTSQLTLHRKAARPNAGYPSLVIAFPPPYARRRRAYGFWLRHNLLRRLASTERQPARTPDIRPSSSLFLHHTRVVAARMAFGSGMTCFAG